MCALGCQIFQGRLHKITYGGAIEQLLTQGLLNHVEGLFLCLCIEWATVFSYHLDDQKLTREVIEKQSNVIQNTRELATLHAAVEAVNICSRLGNAKIKKARSSVQLFQDGDILRSANSREEIVGWNRIGCRVMSSWDNNVPERNVRDTLHKIAHPIRVKADWKVDCGNCRDAAS